MVSRERYCLSDVMESADSSDETLESVSESTGGDSSVLSEVEISLVVFDVVSMVFDSLKELVVVTKSFRSSDDLTVSFWSEEIVTFCCSWMVWIFWHVECFDLEREVGYEERLVVLVHDHLFVVCTKVFSLFDVRSELLKFFDDLSVCLTWEWTLNCFEF